MHGWFNLHFESSVHQFVPNELAAKGIVILLAAFFSLFIFNGMFMLFELHNIRRPRYLARYRRGFLFQMIALPITIVISYPVFALKKWFGFEPLISADHFGVMAVFYPLLVLLVYDFSGYWIHRAQHKFEFLWRFHAVHHEIRNLNTWNSYVHFGELFIVTIINSVTILILFNDPATGIAFVTAFFARNGNFVHSDSPELSLPPALRHIFVDNVYHHYHHARDPQFHDVNFAAHFSIVDRIFGTQVLPKDDAFPQTGIDDYPVIDTIPDYLWRPFTKVQQREMVPIGSLADS